MDQALLTPLSQLETSLNSLLTSLTTTNTYTAAPAATQSLLNADDALSSALTQLRRHQDNYTRILTLRAEADRLQSQIRDIVRTCGDLRNEIGQINHSILDESDDGDEDEASNAKSNGSNVRETTKPVDYETLLGFAARIGKHNAAAAVEAERQSNRRHAGVTRAQLSESNGKAGQQGQAGDTTMEIEQDGLNNTTQESLAELAAINDTLAQQRAMRGMAFPPGEALRMGALGRLQYLREQEGEDAVIKEIERLIQDSENVAAPESTELKEDIKDVSTSTTKVEPAQVERPTYDRPQPRPQPPPHHSLPPKPKMTLDLDFPGSDDDEDD